jgi:hypothetical protein
VNFVQQACRALSERMQAVLRLQIPPTIIDANPSEVAEFPSVSIMPEDFVTTWYQEDEIGVDEDGNLLLGALADIRNPAGAAMLDDGVSHLSLVGRDACSGRIFVGARLPPKREQVQSQISRLFMSDSMTPGILEVVIPRPRVGPHVLPWPWTASFRLGNRHWTPEHAFSERLFAFLEFDLDLPILVDRQDPLVMNAFLKMRSGSQQDPEEPVDYALAHAESYQITEDDTVPIP